MDKLSNEELIEEYLNFKKESTRNMRKSSLNYFFGEKHYNYTKHIFDLTDKDFLGYFNYLKKLETVSIQTRRNKWSILRSFLKLIKYLYKEPKNFEFPPMELVEWKNAPMKNGKKNGNGKVFADKEDLEKLLTHLKTFNFKYYIIMRIFTETGMRKGELINCKIDDLILERRHFHIKEGKTGQKIYPFSEGFLPILTIYVDQRKRMNVNSEYLFISRKSGSKYNDRAFNLYLNSVRKHIRLEKHITTKTFRKSVNNLRKKMGCPNEDRAILLGHNIERHSKLSTVNIENYTEDTLENHIEIYDKWFPYHEISL